MFRLVLSASFSPTYQAGQLFTYSQCLGKALIDVGFARRHTEAQSNVSAIAVCNSSDAIQISMWTAVLHEKLSEAPLMGCMTDCRDQYSAVRHHTGAGKPTYVMRTQEHILNIAARSRMEVEATMISYSIYICILGHEQGRMADVVQSPTPIYGASLYIIYILVCLMRVTRRADQIKE